MPTCPSFSEIRHKSFWVKLSKYYVCLCRGAALTTGFLFAHWLVRSAAVDVLVYYLQEDGWNIPNAVGIVGLLQGLTSMLQLPLTYISEYHVGPLKVILLSSAAYIVGMVMFCISTFDGIPDDKIGMYFLYAVPLIAVGVSGGEHFLEEFLVVQLEAHEPKQDVGQSEAQERKPNIDEDRVNARMRVWWTSFRLFCAILTPAIFTNADSKSALISSTSVMGIGFMLFLCCIPLYHKPVDTVATAEIPRDRLPETIDNGTEVCARSLVEQCKPLFIMIPMWTTFLVFGLVLLTGDTFFTDQAGMSEALVYVLIMIRKIIKYTSSYFMPLLLKCVPKGPKDKGLEAQGIRVGIWIAMVLSVFCCCVAWRVEIRRLHAIMECVICVDYDYEYKDECSPAHLSWVWLLPQFCLLGLMEGIGKQCLDLFFEVQISDVPKKYGSALNEAVVGCGSFINALLVFNLTSWFNDNLNCSRLDIYYKMLMILSFVNLCYYWFVSTFYSNKKET